MFRALLLFAVLFSYASAFSKEIALSFDDSPSVSSPIFGSSERASRMRKTLKERSVEQVIFFATPRYLDETTKKILRDHSDSGHLIANHSHTHKHFNETTLDAYLEDFRIAHRFLKDIPNFTHFWRFPYLDGSGDKDKKDGFVLEMQKMGYRSGYVTCDNSEWVLEGQLIKALKANKKINYEALGDLYVETILSDMEFFLQLGERYIGKNVKHVLLLHENEVAGLFLGKLINGIRSAGWKIISPTEAYSDTRLMKEPVTIRVNQGRIMAYALDAGYEGPWRNPLETPETLLERIRERRIFQ